MPTVTVFAWCLIASTGSGELLDRRGERGGEVLDDGARRADLAVLDLVRVERQRRRSAYRRSDAEPRPRCSPRGDRRSAPARRPSKNRRRRRFERGGEPLEQVVGAPGPARRPPLRSRRAPRAAAGPTRRWRARPRSRTGARPRSTSTKPSARVRPRAPRWSRARRRNRLVALGGDHDRRGPVGPVDRDLLGDVVGVRPGEPGGADDDQRLGREVDVLLVLGDVAGDRLVAELRELDPQLVARRCG